MSGNSIDGIILDEAVNVSKKAEKTLKYDALANAVCEVFESDKLVGFTPPPPYRKLTFIEKYETHIISFALGFTVAWVIASIVIEMLI